MITRIVKIGNSQGIRIPKILLEHCGLQEEVEIAVEKNQLIIRAKRSVREGWDNAFRTMAVKDDDQLLDRDSLMNQSSWDSQEWEW